MISEMGQQLLTAWSCNWLNDLLFLEPGVLFEPGYFGLSCLALKGNVAKDVMCENNDDDRIICPGNYKYTVNKDPALSRLQKTNYSEYCTRSGDSPLKLLNVNRSRLVPFVGNSLRRANVPMKKPISFREKQMRCSFGRLRLCRVGRLSVGPPHDHDSRNCVIPLSF